MLRLCRTSLTRPRTNHHPHAERHIAKNWYYQLCGSVKGLSQSIQCLRARSPSSISLHSFDFFCAGQRPGTDGLHVSCTPTIGQARIWPDHTDPGSTCSSRPLPSFRISCFGNPGAHQCPRRPQRDRPRFCAPETPDVLENHERLRSEEHTSELQSREN